MNRKINLSVFFTILYFFLQSVVALGQDVSFSQFYTNPIYLNPAFAGSIGVLRATTHYRNQWGSFNDAYASYSASVDFPVEKLQGGIGINVLNDAQASGALNNFQFNCAYSVFIQLSKETRMHGAIQVGFCQNALMASELIFADNLDAYYGNHGVSQELDYLTGENTTYADFSGGLLFYSKRIFYGVAVHHLTEPRQTYYSDSENAGKLYRKYTLHFGARLPVFLHGHLRKKFDVSPHIIVQQQGSFQQINYGIFATKWGLTAGGWFRQNFGVRYDSVIFSLGFFKSSWQFTYSYDFTVSGLSGYSGGSNEVSLALLFGGKGGQKQLPFYNRYEEEFGVR